MLFPKHAEFSYFPEFKTVSYFSSPHVHYELIVGVAAL